MVLHLILIVPNELWITHNNPIYPQPAADFTGEISKLTLDPLTSAFDADIQDYVTGLPRSAKDHLSNSLAFGPDGKLYMTQSSNSAMDAPLMMPGQIDLSGC